MEIRKGITSSRLVSRLNRRLAKADFHIGGEGIRRVRVKVWSQAMWRHAPAEEVADRNHCLGRGNLHLDVIQPAPNMHLPDLGAGDAITDAARQMRLAASQFDCLSKGFF